MCASFRVRRSRVSEGIVRLTACCSACLSSEDTTIRPASVSLASGREIVRRIHGWKCLFELPLQLLERQLRPEVAGEPTKELTQQLLFIFGEADAAGHLGADTASPDKRRRAEHEIRAELHDLSGGHETQCNGIEDRGLSACIRPDDRNFILDSTELVLKIHLQVLNATEVFDFQAFELHERLSPIVVASL